MKLYTLKLIKNYEFEVKIEHRLMSIKISNFFFSFAIKFIERINVLHNNHTSIKLQKKKKVLRIKTIDVDGF